MRVTALVAAAVLLAACGGAGAISTASPSSAAAQLTCSLPAVTFTKNGGSLGSQSGFIAVPAGTFSPDAAGNGYTYDRAYQRWLPVLASQVLPDGSAYTYENELPDGPYEIHAVDVATGADTMVLHMPYDSAYSIVAMKPEGIYLVPVLHRSGTPTGLWLFNPNNATVTAVAGAAGLTWNVIEGGAAWGGAAGGDSLDRLDLSTGVVTTWFQHAIAPQPGIGSSYGPGVVGFDLSGHPLIEFYPPVDSSVSPATQPSPEVWIATSPGQATKVKGFALPASFLQRGVTDSHGAWLVGADGFYLFTDRFRRAAPMPPGPNGDFMIAGGCA